MGNGSADQSQPGTSHSGAQISRHQTARLAREARALRDNLRRRKAASNSASNPASSVASGAADEKSVPADKAEASE